MSQLSAGKTDLFYIYNFYKFYKLYYENVFGWQHFEYSMRRTVKNPKNCFLFVLKWPDERSWSWARDKRLHSFTECDDDTWIAKFSKSVECDSHHNFMGTFATFKKPFRFGFVFVLTEAAQCVYFYYLTTLATSINVLKIKSRSRFCWLANLAVRKTSHNFCKSLRSVNLGSYVYHK